MKLPSDSLKRASEICNNSSIFEIFFQSSKDLSIGSIFISINLTSFCFVSFKFLTISSQKDLLLMSFLKFFSCNLNDIIAL